MIASSSNNETNNTLWDKVGIPTRGLALQSAIRTGLSYDVFLQIAEITRIDKKELAACLFIAATAPLHLISAEIMSVKKFAQFARTNSAISIRTVYFKIPNNFLNRFVTAICVNEMLIIKGFN
jgi:hypothetical protein